jgi:hypothetical protein
MNAVRATSLAAVLCLVPACGSSKRVVIQDTPTRQLPVGQAVGDVQTDAYGTSAPHAVTHEEDVARATEIVQGQRGDITHDPRLDAVASLIANTLAEKQAFPARTLTQWYAWQAGVTGNISALFADYGVGEVPRGEMDRLLKKRVRQLPEQPAAGTRSQFGIARVMVEGVSFQVFLVADDHCQLEPFTKQLTAGATVSLKGRCFGDVELPQLYLDTSPTQVE